MGKQDKVLMKVLSGRADANISFEGLINLLVGMGFRHRQQGSHHVLSKEQIPERLTLQADGAKAKRYQVRQVRTLILKYQLKIHD